MGNKRTLGEFDVIGDLFAPLADNDAARGLADDAACFTPPADMDIIISTDTLVSGVHFPETATGDLVARRVLACNLSDLAAKGAQPAGCLLTLGVAPDWGDRFLTGFAAALGDGLRRANMQLWGGDTVSSATGFASLTVHGLVPGGQMLTRFGAQAGDDVYVTGTIGDGWLGLRDMSPAYTDPQPPLAFGRALVGLASAALDVSDGLVADLSHMCRASGGAIELQASSIPLSQTGRDYLAGGGTMTQKMAQLLGGGDDLQIAFTAAPQQADAIIDKAQKSGVAVTRIGRFISPAPHAATVRVMDDNGQLLDVKNAGFTHF